MVADGIDTEVAVKFDQALQAHVSGSSHLARTLYGEVLAVEPCHAEAHNNLAALLQDEGSFDGAVEHYHAALEHDQSFHDAAFNLGMLYQDNDMLQEAVGLYKHCLRISADRLDAWINLGTSYHALGDMDKSIFAYKKALEKSSSVKGGTSSELDPKVLSSVNEHLGRALLRKRDQLLQPDDSVEKLTADAVRYLSVALQLDDTNEIARHMMMANLDLLTTEIKRGLAVDLDGTGTAPEEYVRKLFDDYSENFEASLSNLDYRVPQFIMEYLSTSPRGNPSLVIDLGCGTGLLGPLFAATNLTQPVLVGVDLSLKMLHEAEKKDTYDYLVAGDIVKFLWLMRELIFDRQFAPLETTPRRKLAGSRVKSLEALEQQGGLDETFPLTKESFDGGGGAILYAAADVFVYIGDLEPLFKALAALVRKGDFVIFTVENADTGETKDTANQVGWVLQSTGRYAHRLKYIEGLLTQEPCNGRLKLISVERVVPRRELDKDIQGYLIVLEGV